MEPKVARYCGIGTDVLFVIAVLSDCFEHFKRKFVYLQALRASLIEIRSMGAVQRPPGPGARFLWR